MTEDKPQSGSAGRSWLERLGHVFGGEPRDQNELIALLRDVHDRGLVDSEALSMLEGVLQVSDMQVREVMIPRAQMVVIEHDWPLQEIVSVVVESGHSRLPVIGESRDDVVGILLAKDLLRFWTSGDVGARLDLRECLRTVKVIPESKRLNVLLREFRSTRLHMAIVVDEYGGVAGLVTIEDVLEQIVGEIDDEHDVDDDIYIKDHGGGVYVVKAVTPIAEFNEFFRSSFSDEEFDTIGGLLLGTLGQLPAKGEEVDLDAFRFTILRADNRRIHLLKLRFDGRP